MSYKMEAKITNADNGEIVGLGRAREVPDAVHNAFLSAKAVAADAGEFHVEVYDVDEDDPFPDYGDDVVGVIKHA